MDGTNHNQEVNNMNETVIQFIKELPKLSDAELKTVVYSVYRCIYDVESSNECADFFINQRKLKNQSQGVTI
jgi:hypothetical protein